MSALRLQLATLATASLISPLGAFAQSAQQTPIMDNGNKSAVSLPNVVIIGQHKLPPLVASCDMQDGVSTLPASPTPSVARDQLGIHACIEGDFEKIFAVPGSTRRTYFNQLVHAYSEISNGLREGRAATGGPLNFVNNMDVTYIPDNNPQQVRYNFSWVVRRPVSEVTLENALPNSERRGDYVYTELNGIMAVPLIGTPKKADYKPQ